MIAILARLSFRRTALAAAAALVLAVAAGPAAADEHETVIKSHGLSVFGDLKYPPDFPHFDYVNPDAPKAGEYSTTDVGTFDSFNPYITKGNPVFSVSIIYDSLMQASLDEPDSLYGLVAESAEYPESREWVIFNLRPEARWADGEPITAEDVIFSHETLRDKGIPSLRLFYEDIVSMEALDTHRVRFDFNPEAELRDMLLSVASFTIFPKHYWETREFADTTLEPPLGSGPYKIKEFDAGRSVVYERDDNYWAKDLPVNVGHHNFDTLRFEYFADANAAFEGFKAGQTTFRQESSALRWSEEYGFPAVNRGDVVLNELPDNTIQPGSAWVFNLRKEKFQDPRVREAVAMMFNFEWSNRSLFFDRYKRVQSFWENSILKAEGLPSDAELELLEPVREYLPEAVFTEEAYVPPVSGDRQIDRRLRRQASDLLEAAGWVVGDDGIRRNAAGETLEVEFINWSPDQDRVLGPYVENLKQIGIDAVLTRVDTSQWMERRQSFDFDLIAFAYTNSLTPGSGSRQFFDSRNADVPSRNVMGLKNEGVDKLLGHVITATNRDDLQVATHALDRTLRALKFWVPRWYLDQYWVAYWNYYEYPETLPEFSPGIPSIWWANEEKYQALRASGAL